MGKTKISWATQTINVVTGCAKPAATPQGAFDLDPEVFDAVYPDGIEEKWKRPGTSPECVRCYAEALSLRRGWSDKPWQEINESQNVKLKPERFRDILKLKPAMLAGISGADAHAILPPSLRERIFICSMGDIFHELVPDEFLQELWRVMQQRPEHIYMLLTKRIDRAAQWPGPWPSNVWLGTTCGHPVTKWRLEHLRDSGAAVRFVSMEPLLASMLPVNFDGIDQIIVGGESGAGFRPMKMEWARELRDAAAEAGSAFFYKQDSAFQTEKRPYLVEEDGRQMQYRQFPGEMIAPTPFDPSDEHPLPILS